MNTQHRDWIEGSILICKEVFLLLVFCGFRDNLMSKLENAENTMYANPGLALLTVLSILP